MRFKMLFIASFGLAAPFLFAEKKWMADDEIGNLDGDPKRLYMDITRATADRMDDLLSIHIENAARFPNSISLLGMGCHWEVGGFEDDEEEPVLKFRVMLSDEGWGLEFLSPSQIPPGTEFSVKQKSFELRIPQYDLTGISRIEVSSTTASYPKWRPITSHPIITIGPESQNNKLSDEAS